MKKLVFATHNTHKLEEVSQLLSDRYEVVGLTTLGCHDEIPETGTTLVENALIKARYVYEKFGLDCFADDTGLEVKALNGAPGVYSARYAGEPSNASNNIRKLMRELEGEVDRSARFMTVIACIVDGKEYICEGKVEGQILTQLKGEGGFGYDPVFTPDGYDQTFAEMSGELKNSISHRGRAVQELVRLLNTL